MAISSVERISGNPLIRNFRQATGGAANDFYAGDLVKFDLSTGGIIISTAGHTLGIAKKNAPGNVTTDVPVDVITNDSSEFAIKCNTTTTAAMKGQHGDITFTLGGSGSTGHTVTANTTSGSDVLILDVDPRQAVGTSGGKLIVNFLPPALATGIKTA